MPVGVTTIPDDRTDGPNLTPMLLTPTEAGRVLSVGRTTVYHLMSTGQLESVSIGRSRRITLEAIRRYVDGLTATPVGA
jgi:excisionase family DNA binding protein